MNMRELFDTGDSFMLYGLCFDAKSQNVQGGSESCYWAQVGGNANDEGGLAFQISEEDGELIFTGWSNGDMVKKIWAEDHGEENLGQLILDITSLYNRGNLLDRFASKIRRLL